MERTKINENIYRLTIPYKDIYTTVYIIKTDCGTAIFDSASYDEDIRDCVIPFLNKLGVTAEDIRCVLISHNHADHSGGLSEFMKNFPACTILSRSPQLKEKFAEYKVISPEDGEIILDTLKIITIPGHTKDAISVYDMRTSTLITGDCLQLYGIYGSGKWGSNISLTDEHAEAIEKLRKTDINHILTAHDYHPMGYSYEGKEAVSKALDACIAPLREIKDLILKNPESSDEEIAEIYNSLGNPVIGAHVVAGVRKAQCF